MNHKRSWTLTLAVWSLLSGCESEFTPFGGGGVDASGGGGAGGAGAGPVGAGGWGAGGAASFCSPGEEQPCYDGPPETLGVGVCEAGTATCSPDGAGFGPCEGQVVPSDESCDTFEDDDCDGTANEEGDSCVCLPGEQRLCYSGPSGTQSVGLCSSGVETCNIDGLGFGACDGEVTPVSETCGDPGDEDCDGETNEDGPDCACVPGSLQSCYSADPGTLGVGLCQAGTQECAPDGLGFLACVGEVTPIAEVCSTNVDDDCDGAINEPSDGCVCTPGSISSCYTGPPGTLGVGVCSSGSATCNSMGTGYGACVGQVVPSPEDCAVPADEDCDGVAGACAGAHLWSKRFGDVNDQFGRAVTTDAADNVVMTGSFQGTVSFGGANLSAGGADLFVAKYDAAGAHLWSKRFGDGSTQSGAGVATDVASNIVLAARLVGSIDLGGGNLTSAGGDDVLLAKLDSAGNHLWSKRFGDANHQGAQTLRLDGAGNVIVAGTVSGSIDFGGGALTPPAGSSRNYLAKLDAAGNHLWSKMFHGQADVATDAAANVVLGGRFFTTIDLGGGPLVTAGGVDVVLAKFDAAGNHLWSKQLGGAGDEAIDRVVVDAAGNILVAGHLDGSVDLGGGMLTTAGGNDVFVAKFDPLGEHLWSARFGDGATQEPMAISTDGAAVFVSGYLQGTIDFGGGPLVASSGTRIFVAKLGSSGAHQWSKVFGSIGFSYGHDLANDSAGHLLTVGIFGSAIDFGGGLLSSAGDDDIFLAKLAN